MEFNATLVEEGKRLGAMLVMPLHQMWLGIGKEEGGDSYPFIGLRCHEGDHWILEAITRQLDLLQKQPHVHFRRLENSIGISVVFELKFTEENAPLFSTVLPAELLARIAAHMKGRAGKMLFISRSEFNEQEVNRFINERDGYGSFYVNLVAADEEQSGQPVFLWLWQTKLPTFFWDAS